MTKRTSKKVAKTVSAADDADLDIVVAQLEATESQSVESEAASKAEVEMVSAEALTGNELDSLMQAVGDDEVKSMMERTSEAISERERFEESKNPDNANIHRTLKNVRGSLLRSHAARVMQAAEIAPWFINRSIHDGSRYNVYAIGKFADFVDGLAGSGLRNAINIACMRSLFRFHAAGVAFTGEMARAAASDKIRVAESLRKHLVRHTVSASTAPTQASSTMQALTTLGVVRAEGPRRNPTYVVQDGPVTRKLKALADELEVKAA